MVFLQRQENVSQMQRAGLAGQLLHFDELVKLLKSHEVKQLRQAERLAESSVVSL